MKSELIGLCGVSGAGKDTIAGILCEKHCYSRVSVADPIKNCLLILFGFTREQLWGGGRNTCDPRLKRTPRSVFQDFGDFCERIEPDIWVRKMSESIRSCWAEGTPVVVPDLRTERTAEAVRNFGGELWLVRRRGAGAPGTLGEHRHERELATKPEAFFSRILENSGTVEELSDLVAAAVGQKH